MSEIEQDKTLMLMEETLWQRTRRILAGLKAPKDSGEYRFARFELTRMMSSWGLSLGISIASVFALITFAVGQKIARDQDIEVTVIQPEEIKLDEIKEEIQKIEDTAEPPPDATPIDMPTIGDNSPVDAPAPKVADVTPSVTPIMTKSPLILKGLAGTLVNRSASARSGALKGYGGSKATEDAVLRALRWLKDNQGPEGSWAKVDNTEPTAMAGLALLCFLAHGETPASPEFGLTVEKTMKYIVSRQAKEGTFGREYTHGICTYALAEGFALTKIMALKEAVEKGMRVIVDGQQPQGGYDYGYAKKDRWDLSVAGWQFQAMKAAKMAGLGTPKLDEAIRKGIDYMRTQAYAAKQGGFGYSGKPGEPGTGASPSMTAAGTLCLQLLGRADCPEVRAALASTYLKDMKCDWVQPEAPKKGPDGKPVEGRKNAVYAWYYATQAKFQKGGKDWELWNQDFSTTLVRAQAREGYWENGDHGGKVYTTTLCCLMMEVYYRYLPTYKHVEAAPEVKPEASDDIVVDVR
jgi:hypothetical protein